MDIPHFMQHPPSDTEMQTAHLLCKDMNMDAVARARNLSRDTIKTHTSALRYKFHTTTITGAICRMIALGYLPADGLIHHLPDHWHKYVVVYQKPARQKKNAEQ